MIEYELKFFKNSQIIVENLERNHVHLTARHGIVFGRKILETKQFFVNELLAQRLQAT